MRLVAYLSQGFIERRYTRILEMLKYDKVKMFCQQVTLNEIKHYTTEKLSIYPYNRGARYAKYDQVQHLVFFAENVIYVNELICNTKTYNLENQRTSSVQKVKRVPFWQPPAINNRFFSYENPGYTRRQFAMYCCTLLATVHLRY